MSEENDLEIQKMELLIAAINKDSNNAINNIDQRGKKEILNKVQLPIYANTINKKHYIGNIKETKDLVVKKYKELGIEIINEENDLFYNVKLPNNIKLTDKDRDSVYWTYLINEEG